MQVNVAPVENKTNYKTQFPGSPLSSPPPQRQIITPYDATEDLRAKVKLVRHGLNEIKQSYLMNEEKKDRNENKYSHNRNDINLSPVTKKTEKFVTNLVPYEKNQSYKVNAAALDDNPKNYYNYLGEKENPAKTFVPISNMNAQRNLFRDDKQNDEVDKTAKTPVKMKIPREGHTRNVEENCDERKMESTSRRMGPSSSREEPVENRRVNSAADNANTGATPKKVTSNGAVPKR